MASSPSSSSPALSEMQQAMKNILAIHANELHTKIHAFPAKAQKAFFDQVTRRFVPQPDNVASYIEENGVPMRNTYLNIVHELLFHNPYNGYYPPIKADNAFRAYLKMVFNNQRRFLAYAHMDVVFAHLSETLFCYPLMIPKRVGDLIQLDGEIKYLYNAVHYPAYVTIDLPSSYPEAPPQVRISCKEDSAINPDHMYIAASGRLFIPYQGEWDRQSSRLLQLLLHMCLEFTSQPPTFLINVGIKLSSDRRELLRILLDYKIMHLYNEIERITPQETDAFFHEVTDRYRKEGIVDLPQHIRSSKVALKKFISIVAAILGQPPKTRSTVDIGDHRFLP